MEHEFVDLVAVEVTLVAELLLKLKLFLDLLLVLLDVL